MERVIRSSARYGQNREGMHQVQQRAHHEEDRKRKREVEPEKEKQSKKKRIVWTDTDEEGSQEKRPTTLKRSDRARAPTPEISKPDEVEKLKKGLKKRRPLEDKEEEKELRTKLKEFLEDYDDERDDPKFYKGRELQRRLADRLVNGYVSHHLACVLNRLCTSVRKAP